MDIYFCDLCGARVSDIDLRGGHGIRKQYDVICANCLELGHGKEWLAKHQRTRPASAAGAVKAPAVKAMAAAASPTIDAARDRVRTLEEGDMTPAIPAKVVAADDSLDGDAQVGELEAEEAAGSDTPAPVASSFAAAANSFSALSVQQPKPASASHDDLDDAAAPADGQVIAEAASPFELDAKAESKAGRSGEEAETEDGDGGRRGRQEREVSQKDETLPVDRPIVVAPEEKTPSGRKSSSSSTPERKSATKNSKANVKASGKSGRRAKKNNNIYIMTGLSIAILTMIMLIIISQQSSGKKERVIQKIEISETVKRAISDARVDADSALRTKSPGEMKAARDKIQAIRGEIDKWEAEADRQKWTDDEKGLYMERIGWPATASRIRLLNDEIVKAGAGN